MAIEYAREIHTGRGGGDSLRSGAIQADDTRVWRVKTTSPYDGPTDVLSATGIPVGGEQHPDDPNLYVSSRRAVNEAFSKLVWIVTIQYQLAILGKSTNPVSDPAEITWNTETTEREVHWDRDGNAILNSAGDYYEDGVKAEFADWTVRMKKNLAFVPQWIMSYRNAVNSDDVYIDGVFVEAGTAKITGLQIGPWQIRNSVPHRSVEIAVKITDDWASHPLDMGLFKLVATGSGSGSGYKRVRITDGDGVPVSKPVLLDGSGGVLENPSPATAVFGEHDIFSALPFSYFLY
jgi:hypothetical protein